MKIAEDANATEGAKLSGDLVIGNCNLIALRRISPRVGAEGAKRETANLSGKRTEFIIFFNASYACIIWIFELCGVLSYGITPLFSTNNLI